VYGLTATQKYDRLPFHCTKDLKLVVEELEGFESKDWNTPERSIMRTFHRYDMQDKLISILKKLLAEGPGSDMRLFLLKYSSITTALIKDN